MTGRDARTALDRMDVAWARSLPARAARELFLVGVLGPLMDLYTRRQVRGREYLDGVAGPAILVANHTSHMDTPTILRSLPRRMRRRTAVCAAADYFYRSRPLALGASLGFGTVPIQRHGGGIDPTSTAHLDALIADGWTLVMFAEGTRSRDGSVARLRTGAAVLAERHGVPIIPVHVDGTHDAMPVGQGWPKRARARFASRRHPVEVRFGRPLRRRDGEDRLGLMERVRLFLAESGASTTPDRRVLGATRARADRR